MRFFGDIWNGLSSAAMWWAHNNLGLGAIDKVQRELLGFSTVPSALGYNGNGDSYRTAEQKQLDEDRAYQSAREDLAYERTMDASNTAYQRGAEDLKSAGLNPAMVYSAGGASTPSFSASSYPDFASSMQAGKNNVRSTLANTALLALRIMKGT